MRDAGKIALALGAVGVAGVVIYAATRKKPVPVGETGIDIEIIEVATGKVMKASSPVELVGNTQYIISVNVTNRSTRYGSFVSVPIEYTLRYGLTGSVSGAAILAPNSVTAVEQVVWVTPQVAAQTATDITFNISVPVPASARADVVVIPEAISYVIIPVIGDEVPDEDTAAETAAKEQAFMDCLAAGGTEYDCYYLLE